MLKMYPSMSLLENEGFCSMRFIVELEANILTRTIRNSVTFHSCAHRQEQGHTVKQRHHKSKPYDSIGNN